MATIVVQPASGSGLDTTLRDANPTFNAGANTTINIGKSAVGTLNGRILIKFDVSSIPAGAVVQTATLSLFTNSAAAVSVDVAIHRSLVEWYEGNQTGGTPGAGENASTWNLRNHNGSVAWAGGAGGGSSSDYEATPTDNITIPNNATGVWRNWDVTADVEGFHNGSYTNHGWWLIGSSSADGTFKSFHSSDSPTSSFRPSLTIEYILPFLIGQSDGSSQVQADIVGVVYATGEISGQSVVDGMLTSNEYVNGSSEGQTTVEGTVHAVGRLAGQSSGNSSIESDLKAIFYAVGNANGISVVLGDIKGIFYLDGSSAGTSSAGAFANFQGRLRTSISGSASVTGLLWGKATGVAAVIGCNTLPLLYITDGSIRPNGQLNLLNFLSEGSGFKLNSWRPKISQYKEGGRFSNGPLAQGRRLRYRNFDNVIETFELRAIGQDQDALIEFQQELMGWQEAAADYWVSDFVVSPVYLVAKAARETYERYAIIHMISVPELENPYIEPFFGRQNSVFETITPQIERGHWLSTPPGQFECVPISSVRSWTVSGWESGS